MELELSMTKLRAEEASLRDSLSKLSALNESLAQDKLGLNHLVAQVCRVPACPPVLPTQTPLRHPGPSLSPRPASPHISLCTSVPVPIHLGLCLFLTLSFSLSLHLSVYPLSWSERKDAPWSLLPSPRSPVSTCPRHHPLSPGSLPWAGCDR